MTTTGVHEDRVQRLDDGTREPDPAGGHVLYWMQRSQRAEHNDALEHALALADEHDVPVHVVFGLTTDYPEASGRHFRFVLEGLAEVAVALGERGIPFAVRPGHPVDVAEAAAAGAVEVVTDRGYLRQLVAWRRDLVERLDLPVWQVEGDVVVPVEVATDKHEYAARTIRRKLNAHRDDYLAALGPREPARTGPPLDGGLDLSADVEDLLERLGFDRADGRRDRVRGGLSHARHHREVFLRDGLAGYGERRPRPATDVLSLQSPYLHFGQVSPVELALAVRDTDHGSRDDREGYLEELVVRRELAINHVVFEDAYDRYEMLPDWARTTLDEHREDPREHVYDYDELLHGRTHDRAWNACMAQVREEGFLHNHLRMYWGKQVLKWSRSPEEAFEHLSRLNNEHFLDGRDPNSYTGVAWCFGLHDRAWQETDVAGKTRPMTRSGLDSKVGKRRLRAWMDAVEDAHGPLRGE